MKNLNRYLILFLVAILSIVATSITAKNKQQSIYAFGFASSFNDSTVYFTDIHQIDSAWVQEKIDFLVGRPNYSYQFRDYLAQKGDEHRTCIIVYALKKDKLEKKYLKMRKKYTTKGNYQIKYISTNEFHFSMVKPDNSFQEEPQPVQKGQKGTRPRDPHRQNKMTN